MAPAVRIAELKNHFTPAKDPMLAGVLALCYPKPDGSTMILLILRKSYPGIHSNQVALPGGKKEADDADLMETALRETKEEVGVPPSKVEVVRELTPLYIPPSNFRMSPYLGYSTSPLSFKKQDEEVEELIEVPLRQLTDPVFEGTKVLRTSYSDKMEVPVFHFNGHIVWGATAMVLSELRDLIKQGL